MKPLLACQSHASHWGIIGNHWEINVFEDPTGEFTVSGQPKINVIQRYRNTFKTHWKSAIPLFSFWPQGRLLIFSWPPGRHLICFWPPGRPIIRCWPLCAGGGPLFLPCPCRAIAVATIVKQMRGQKTILPIAVTQTWYLGMLYGNGNSQNREFFKIPRPTPLQVYI